MSGIIDWHSHWVTPAELDLLGRRSDLPRVTFEQGKPVFAAPEAGVGGGGKPFPLSDQMTNIDRRLRDLDEAGIERQVVTPLAFGYEYSLSRKESYHFVQAANDDVAELVAKHPDRFSGLASLSTSDPEWSARELERAHDAGLIGAILPLNAFATPEGARVLAPVFEAAQRRRSHLFLHRGAAHPSIPGQPPIESPAEPAYARWALIVDSQLASGAITLGLTDFLDPYPDVTVQLAMLGGAIPYVVEHIRFWAERAGGVDPTPRFRRLYFDPGPYSITPRSVDLAARTFGYDRLLFGTDYGPMPDLRAQLKLLEEAYSPEQRQQVYVENGRRLLAEKRVRVSG